MFATVSYSKFEIIQLEQEESAAKPNVSRKTLFYKCWGHWHCHYLQITCNVFSQ